MRSHPLAELTRVRILEFVREPEAVFWVFAFPIILALALGIAFRGGGAKALHIGVLGTASHPELAAALAASDRLRITTFPSEHEAHRALVTGEVVVLVELEDTVRYRFDPSQPESRLARLEADNVLQRAAGRVDPVNAEVRHVAEKGSRYIDFLVPGLLGMNLMGTGIWGVGFALVQTRQRKLLKRLIVTPMRRSSFLLSYILSRLTFLIAEVAVVVLFAWLAFGVPLRGSLPAFGFVCVLGAMTFAGIGLLLAARARTIEGVSGLMNLTMVPMWLFSGIFFSYKHFPEIMQPFIKALPLTAVNDALRALMLEGRPLPSLWPEIAVAAAWAILSFATAVRLFRWQ
ncbi:MAG: ABC transporter permease [Planctomycetota bacterium]